VHVIAERVTLVHRSLIPPLYALVRRGRPLEDLSGLGVASRATLTLLRERKEVTAGDVRKHLGLPLDARQDPAYAALAGLERLLLVDRGPFEVPKKGIPLFGRVTRLAILFKSFLSAEEIDSALRRLAEKGKVELTGIGRDRIASSTRRP
jgi:hypothetical protein